MALDRGWAALAGDVAGAGEAKDAETEHPWEGDWWRRRCREGGNGQVCSAVGGEEGGSRGRSLVAGGFRTRECEAETGEGERNRGWLGLLFGRCSELERD